MLYQKFIVGTSSRHSRARGNPGFSLDFLDSGLTCICRLGGNESDLCERTYGQHTSGNRTNKWNERRLYEMDK
jgi:hypothetical protein